MDLRSFSGMTSSSTGGTKARPPDRARESAGLPKGEKRVFAMRFAAMRGPRAMALHARGGGAPREAEPVHLADDGIAGDAAEPPRDLASAQAFGPELFQQLHALICPSHRSLPEPSGAGALRHTPIDIRRGRRSARRPSAKRCDRREELRARPVLTLTGMTLGLSECPTRGSGTRLPRAHIGLLCETLRGDGGEVSSSDGGNLQQGESDLQDQRLEDGSAATGRWHIRHMQLCTSGSKLLQRLEEPSAPQAALGPRSSQNCVCGFVDRLKARAYLQSLKGRRGRRLF